MSSTSAEQGQETTVYLSWDQRLTDEQVRTLLCFLPHPGDFIVSSTHSGFVSCYDEETVDKLLRFSDISSRYYGISAALSEHAQITSPLHSSPPTQWIVLVAVCALLTYINAWPGDFVFDDKPAITQNKVIAGNWKDVFVTDFWGNNVSWKYSHKSYRPLTVLTFQWNYQLAGFASALPWKLVNILGHVVVSIVVLWVATFWYPPTQTQRSNRVGLYCGLLFGSHPIHTEVVANIVSRAEILGLFFYLCAFLCHCTAAASKKKLRSGVILSISLVLHLAACLSKEAGFTYVGVVCVAELCFVLRYGWRTAPGGVYRCAVLIAWTAALLFGRRLVQGDDLEISMTILKQNRHINNYVVQDFWPRVLTRFHIHAWYMWLLIFPIDPKCDYSHEVVPIIWTLDNPRNLLTGLAYVVVGVAAVLPVVKLCGSSVKTQEDRDFWTAVFWSVCLGGATFVPASGLLANIATTIGERLLYAPSVGYCLLLALILDALSHKGGVWKKVSLFTCIFLTMSFTCISLKRNPDWWTHDELFEKAYSQTPNSTQLLMSRLSSRIAAKQWDSETEELGIRGWHILNVPPFADRLSQLYTLQGNFSEALKWGDLCTTVVEENDGRLAGCHLQRAKAALGMKNYSLAGAALTDCIRKGGGTQTLPTCHWQAALLYHQHNQTEGAMKHFLLAAQKGNMPMAWLNVATMRMQAGDYTNCEDPLKRALAVNPADERIKTAFQYCQQGQKQKTN